MTGSRQTILIVEDTPENLVMLAQIVAPQHDTMVAESGEEALRMIAERTPDLILLDILLPGIDGYEVCRKLKADTVLRDVPVIFITALESLDEETMGLDMGAVDYITKPFNLPITRLRIRNHLELKAQRDLLAHRTAELEKALTEVKQLKGLVPICAWCKKIRDDRGYWNRLEDYIHRHTEAEFSHGVCPECASNLMGNLNMTESLRPIDRSAEER